MGSSPIRDRLRSQETDGVVDTVIRSLRRKLDPLQNAVETVRGVGYRFIQPDLH